MSRIISPVVDAKRFALSGEKNPYVLEGKKVTATVLEHFKDDTVLVFKKKRRKGYQKLNGHRQPFTQIEINSIS